MAGKIIHSMQERFWEKVDKTGECWLWTANKNKKGYGRLWISGKNEFAHRVSWLIFFGEKEEGLFVLHRCDNPSCVRPDHLFLGTLSENIADRDRKLRTARGERNGNRKLTSIQALDIKKSSISTTELAAKYQIDRSQVFNIKTGRQWKHL